MALSLSNFFALSKTSAMDGGVTFFEKENVYFKSIYELIMHEMFKLTVQIGQLV